MQLEYTSLEKAVESLGIALKEYDKEHNIFVRDSCIQRFEYTYELCHKMLKRQLVMASGNPAEFDTMSFNDLIRQGSQKGLLLNGWDKWKFYRKERGTTSHAYDEEKAKEVFDIIPDFYKEAQYLLEQLKKQNV